MHSDEGVESRKGVGGNGRGMERGRVGRNLGVGERRNRVA